LKFWIAATVVAIRLFLYFINSCSASGNRVL